MGNKDSNEAELLAVVKAMELPSSNKDFVGLDFLVESDSASVVSWLNNPRSRPWKFHEFVVLVSRSSSGLGNVSVTVRLQESRSKVEADEEMGKACWKRLPAARKGSEYVYNQDRRRETYVEG